MISLLLSATISMGVALVATRYVIPWLQAHGIGQPIRMDGPEGHHTKAGTPTMGGITLVIGAVAGYLVSHIRSETIFTHSGLTVMVLIVGAACVGLVDDYLKVSQARNLGLNKKAKLIGLLTVAVVFVVLATQWASANTTVSFVRFDAPGLDLGQVGWSIWAVFIILSMSNAVNLTDGLDGLAGGSGAVAFAAFGVIGLTAFRNPEVYTAVNHGLDLAIVAVAMAGACIGFLWWNAPPARVFMGDTGSLAIGSGLAGLALMLDTQLLLPIIGGLYVLETLSVSLQVAGYKMTGKRLFRMAPIHHHFELAGWPETTVLIRLWIINGLFVMLALGIFYADFINIGGTDPLPATVVGG
ncbi:MAG: phospho-N-acetylmuramoyl-pentapeptide-transferase [Actinomycetia bacterium]|nr:phospho-N-acetylmuramoyl-pentapeptide-transferase [Actinomycetes bacterium]MCP4962622.1 phospho-N-acetylmuramoyl-pentapeptide-transferase [Actinomycetes bacterium]